VADRTCGQTEELPHIHASHYTTDVADQTCGQTEELPHIHASHDTTDVASFERRCCYFFSKS
jgi:hypothetical protein